MATNDPALGFSYPSSSPQMLCFDQSQKYRVKASVSVSVSGAGDSLSASSSNNSSSSSSITKSKRNRTKVVKTEVECKKTSKKPKTGNPTSTKGVKVRKEKLGERIAALQKLVSPFGKTDTASVLHEAMGYIRFLHDQVQVLSSPYLQRMPSSCRLIGEGREEEEKERIDEQHDDLRSRGLCLVPLESTAQMASSNGADFWSPAMGNNSLRH